jgi:transcriptional regulator with XRE-family HTH domain
MIRQSFGIACKKFREEIDLSQEKFALQIDMDRTYYASVEAGKRNISIQNIKKIVDGFGVSLSYFFEIVDKMESRKE